MSVSNFNLRGVTPDVMSRLKKEAQRLHLSINVLILKLIESGLGISREINRPVYHDLDHLAGTWSIADVEEFKKNTQDFDLIDKDIWS